MRVHHLHFFPPTTKCRKEVTGFDGLIQSGKAIEVTARTGRKAFQGVRVAIAVDVYERMVQWSSFETREHGIYLEEEHRLQDLLNSASPAVRDHGTSCFVHKALCADVSNPVVKRVPLMLSRFEEGVRNEWLISSVS